MKITVINGSEKHGVTWILKEIFLEPFRSKAEIVEYYLPKDCPNFCMGCATCILKGEDNCKDASYIKKIEASLLEADLIVMCSPAYVMHTTGAMKALLDHFAYRWMPHRPLPQMFQKRAVIISQCLGAGAKSCAKDIKDSLSWWGISKIYVYSQKIMEDINWDKISDKRKTKLVGKIKSLSNKLINLDYHKPAKTSIVNKGKFYFCRMLQKSLYENDSEYLDAKYWKKQGWLDNARPWKI